LVSVQNRLIKETLKEPEPDLLEANKWEKDEDNLKWNKFVNQRLEEKLNGSEFDKLLSRNILGFEEAWPVFNNTLKRMVPNRYYYGSTGEFYKVNVASYIDSLQVIYVDSLSRHWKKDPTMGLRSSKYLMSYSEGDCLNIVIKKDTFLSYLIAGNEWEDRILLRRRKPLVRSEYSRFVVNNYSMVYLEYGTKII